MRLEKRLMALLPSLILPLLVWTFVVVLCSCYGVSKTSARPKISLCVN